MWDAWEKGKEHGRRRHNHVSLYVNFANGAKRLSSQASAFFLICKRPILMKKEVDVGKKDLQIVK